MSLYNHFASKDDLILTVLKHREESLTACSRTGCDATSAGNGPAERVLRSPKGLVRVPAQSCIFINARWNWTLSEASKFSAAWAISRNAEGIHRNRWSKGAKTAAAIAGGKGDCNRVMGIVKPADLAKEAALA
jgi:AcrR family transcriptional regulator